MNQKLKLDDDVRPILVRMEDSIILDLFERAQFKTNDIKKSRLKELIKLLVR